MYVLVICFSSYINEEGVARKQPYKLGFHYRFGRNLSNIYIFLNVNETQWENDAVSTETR